MKKTTTVPPNNPSTQFVEYAGDLGRNGWAALSAVVQSPQFGSFVGLARSFLILVSIILAVLLTLIIIRANLVSSWKRKHIDWYRPAKKDKKAAKTGEMWQIVVETFENSSNPSDWRQAVVVADKLLFFVLEELGFEGTSFSEKLHYVTPAEIRNLGELIPAHRDAAFLAESPTAELSRDRAAEILGTYATALRELGVIVQ